MTYNLDGQQKQGNLFVVMVLLEKLEGYWGVCMHNTFRQCNTAFQTRGVNLIDRKSENKYKKTYGVSMYLIQPRFEIFGIARFSI